MLKKKLLLISVLTVLFIAIFHYFALKYSWYWTYKWLDIPVHFIGGFGVAVTALWFCLTIRHIDKINGYKKRALIVMLGSTFIVGILWEIFELVFKINFVNSIDYWPNTLSDISNGIVGGFFAFLYFIKYKDCKDESMLKMGTSLSMPLKH